MNLPEYKFSFREKDGKRFIFDRIRKKYVRLTPEEWVRQNIVTFLISEREVPEGLISVEKGLVQYGKDFRYDALVVDRSLKPLILIECKAPDIKITDDVFTQIARYNITLQVRYFVVTNGLQHYCCEINLESGTWKFLPDIPHYSSISN